MKQLSRFIKNEKDQQVIQEKFSGQLFALKNFSYYELIQAGITSGSAKRLLEFFAFAIDLMEECQDSLPSIGSPADIAAYMNFLKMKEEENFFIITLNSKNQVTGKHLITKGILDASVVHPREIFKKAISMCASSIILVHNHPSGNPTPSSNDIAITKTLVAAGEVLGVAVIDHLIIGKSQYVSMKEKLII